MKKSSVITPSARRSSNVRAGSKNDSRAGAPPKPK